MASDKEISTIFKVSPVVKMGKIIRVKYQAKHSNMWLKQVVKKYNFLLCKASRSTTYVAAGLT